MNQLPLHPRSDGKRLLHHWRTGRLYFETNREHLERDWNNLMHRHHADYRDAAGIVVQDCRLGMPFPDNSIDGIYSCHVLEHLTKREAPAYLGELNRILRPGAVCRLSTPDLERQARDYLRYLDEARAATSSESNSRHEMAQLFLIDQFTRTFPGGELQRHFEGDSIDETAAAAMVGEVWREFTPRGLPEFPSPPRGSRWERFRATPWSELLDLVRRKIRRKLIGHEPIADGEIEFWRWDSHGLSQALLAAGFTAVKVHTFKTSDLPDWETYQLDTTRDRELPIENSLYIEAAKPGL